MDGTWDFREDMPIAQGAFNKLVREKNDEGNFLEYIIGMVSSFLYKKETHMYTCMHGIACDHAIKPCYSRIASFCYPIRFLIICLSQTFR